MARRKACIVLSTRPQQDVDVLPLHHEDEREEVLEATQPRGRGGNGATGPKREKDTTEKIGGITDWTIY